MPAASATAAQEPEPKPAKQRADERDGSKPAGQAPKGKANTAPEPKTGSERTTATERATKAAATAVREAPADGTEAGKAASKTCAPGSAPRTMASTPVAQPTDITPKKECK